MSAHNALYRYLFQQKKIAYIPSQCDGTDGALRQLEQAGLLSEKEGLNFLSKQFQIMQVDLKLEQTPNTLPSWDLFDFPVLWSNRLCPIKETNSSIVLACCNPFIFDIKKSLNFQTGKTIELVLSPESAILAKLQIAMGGEDISEVQLGRERNRVLVIDDDPDVCEVISLQLFHEDYEVDRASNGLEGLEKVAETNPDLVLLDLRMPVCNGEEFLEKLKANKQTSNLPVIVFTALDTEETEIELLKKGATDFVSKTASKNVLSSRIKTALS